MHGSCVAFLVDMCSTMAIMSVNDFWLNGGVSTDLAVTFVRAIPSGAQVEIESRVVKLGGRLAQTVTELRVGDKVMAMASHTKCNIASRL